jgi:toxin ParE1/3/4
LSGKPVVQRAHAEADVEAAVAYYLDEAGERAASGFIDALEHAYRQITRHPSAGSPRYAHELGLPGLRCRPLRRFPFLIFYVEREDRIDVWRVLHGERDIPTWLRET